MRKVILCLVVLCVIVSLSVFEFLNFTGYSYQDGVWLSNEQFIKIAAAHAVARSRGTYAYASADDLMRRNPQCCTVDRDKQTAWRIIGWYIVVTEVIYQINDKGRQKYYQEYCWMDSAGRILDYAGTETSVP
jgi:hypothetical protein